MKQIVTLFTLIFLLAGKSHGQSAAWTDSVTATYDSLRHWVDTDILADRNPNAGYTSLTNHNPLYFDGTTDSAGTGLIFKDLHAFFYHAAYDENRFIFPPEEYHNTLYHANTLSSDNTHLFFYAGFTKQLPGFVKQLPLFVN